MNIALDFDDTYTCDTTLWDGFIYDAIKRGHDIRIVTMRKRSMTDPALDWLSQILPVIFTEYQQKRAFTNRIGWNVDVWIDDSPEFIISQISLIGDAND